MSDLTLGYDQNFNNAFYTEYVNIRFEDIDVNNDISCNPNNGCLGTFKQKNRMPYNHWRKQRICENKCLDSNGKPLTNQIIFKDPLALSVDNCNPTVKRDNKWRIIYSESERIQREENKKNFISSYKTLNESRNRSYDNNLKPNDFKKNNAATRNGTIIRHNNPKFSQTGAVSGRNRIAALKNGNLHNNVYKKRCDTKTAWYKTNVIPKKCKPYHYGGKWKFALLSCPPKN
jgi:hypothetical protein